MNKRVIKTEKAPKAIGIYSQGIETKDFIFTSGQIGISPETGEIVSDHFELQVIQAFKNLDFILIESGSCIFHLPPKVKAAMQLIINIL